MCRLLLMKISDAPYQGVLSVAICSSLLVAEERLACWCVSAAAQLISSKFNDDEVSENLNYKSDWVAVYRSGKIEAKVHLVSFLLDGPESALKAFHNSKWFTEMKGFHWKFSEESASNWCGRKRRKSFELRSSEEIFNTLCCIQKRERD